MRLAYRRYAGERGFTPEQFRATAEEVAGVDLTGWFRTAISSTEELDYAEALDWFGLRFATPDGLPPEKRGWELELRADATGPARKALTPPSPYPGATTFSPVPGVGPSGHPRSTAADRAR
jgi:predicted metalloprotease with PDZ domain